MFFLLIARPPSSPLFPYTTLFRSAARPADAGRAGRTGVALAGAAGDRADAGPAGPRRRGPHEPRSEEHTSELQSRRDLVCRLLLEKKKILKIVINLMTVDTTTVIR